MKGNQGIKWDVESLKNELGAQKYERAINSKIDETEGNSSLTVEEDSET